MSNEDLYFRKHLLQWHYQQNQRNLPWKEEGDVYRIWVSEIILQQTRVEQGIGYYHRFLKRFPTLQDLALASLEDVYKIWEGLGYYTRAKNMLTTAQMIIDVHGGIFPSDYHQILSLKGIGPYTAAAIASFAFHLPYAVVDGNVYRVMSRFFGDDTPIDGQEGKKKFNALASQCLDRKVPHHYNQAIMDLGAVICKPENPLCTLCPLKKKCKAFLENNPERYPVKSKSKKLKKRYFIFFLLYHGKKIALEKREKKDVWKHLYQFPMIELSSEAEWIMAKKNNFPWPTRDWELLSSGTTAKQLLSHQKIEGKLLIYKIPSSVKKPSEYFWIKPSELKNYPLPRLMHLLLEGEADKKLSSL